MGIAHADEPPDGLMAQGEEKHIYQEEKQVGNRFMTKLGSFGERTVVATRLALSGRSE
jgi:hypothetical protein